MLSTSTSSRIFFPRKGEIIDVSPLILINLNNESQVQRSLGV